MTKFEKDLVSHNAIYRLVTGIPVYSTISHPDNHINFDRAEKVMAWYTTRQIKDLIEYYSEKEIFSYWYREIKDALIQHLARR